LYALPSHFLSGKPPLQKGRKCQEEMPFGLSLSGIGYFLIGELSLLTALTLSLPKSRCNHVLSFYSLIFY
jgi:hypothetical protein